MSTVIGRFSFTYSANADIDFDGLEKALNKFTWSDAQQDAKWIHSANDETFQFESENIEDPTSFPKIYIAEIEGSESGEIFKKNVQEMTDNDHHNLVDMNGDEADLHDFSTEIKPFIRSGSIQISCEANDGKALSYWEQITINSDGTGVASWQINRESGEFIIGNEKF